MTTRAPISKSDDLFGAPVYPAGFATAPTLFSAAEEAAFVRAFEKLPFRPFEFHGYLGNRRIVPFGFRYDYAGGALKASDAIPDFLYPLRDIAGGFSGVAAHDLVQALVTEYAPGAGIGWHRDKPMFEKIVALSFLAPCTLRLRHKSDAGWERVNVAAPPRSGYMLSDTAREKWEHSIAPMKTLRYSVTFRSFRRDYRAPAES